MSRTQGRTEGERQGGQSLLLVTDDHRSVPREPEFGQILGLAGKREAWRSTDNPDFEFDLLELDGRVLLSGYGYGPRSEELVAQLLGRFQTDGVATFEHYAYPTPSRAGMCCQPVLTVSAVRARDGGHVEYWTSHSRPVNGPGGWTKRGVDRHGNTLWLRSLVGTKHGIAFGNGENRWCYFSPRSSGPGRSRWAAAMVPESSSVGHRTWEESIAANLAFSAQDSVREPWELLTAQPVAHPV